MHAHLNDEYVPVFMGFLPNTYFSDKHAAREFMGFLPHAHLNNEHAVHVFMDFLSTL